MTTSAAQIPVLLLGCSALTLMSSALDQEPESLPAEDWAGIRAAYDGARHAAYPVEDGHEARNPGQRWLTRFDGHGFCVSPDAVGWTWGLELECYGFAGSEREVAEPARVKAEGGRLVYEWDETLEEWYVNDTRGLEHGFTVHRQPDGERVGEPLTFTLAVRGELCPEVTASGRAVRFLGGDGAAALTYTGLTVVDADGRELAASFDIDGDRLRLSVDECGARYPLIVDPVVQQAYLKASNTEVHDLFGFSVAASGDTVVVGAPNEDSGAPGVNGNQSDNGAPDSGAAYVFVRNGTTWSQQAYLKASTADAYDLFGSTVAISGDTVVVGARGEDSGAVGVNGNQSDNSVLEAGAVYVFVRIGTTWSQQAYLKASNPDSFDLFGHAIAVSGDTVVVGAAWEASSATGVGGNQNDNGAPGAGAAYVFERSSMIWSQNAYLKASNTDMGDGFGFAVGVSGDTVAVGALTEDSDATGVNGDQTSNGAVDSGAAYVFVRNPGWSQQAYLKASNTEMRDWFGQAVAISGDTVLIGAAFEDSDATGVNGDQNDNSAESAGAAYVFVRAAANWTQQAYLKASNTGARDQFGAFSVALSGDTAVVGAPGEASHASGVNGDQSDDSAPESGAAYVFRRNGSIWSHLAYLKASTPDEDDWFGFMVAVSADTVVVAAPFEDSSATGVNGDQGDKSAALAGAAYVFDLDPSPVGSTYCWPAVPNSSGLPGFILAFGSDVANTNGLALVARQLPTNQFGFFLSSQTQASTFPVPNSQGTLCVGGAIGRYNADVFGTGSAGTGTLTLDLGHTPTPTGTVAIQAGETWNFTAWFRDVNPTPTSNFTDGVSLTFQ